MSASAELIIRPSDYVKLYKEKCRLWKISPDRQQFYERMSRHIPRGGWKNIRKAFCVGVGKLDGRTWSAPELIIDLGRSLAQLAIFMDIVEYLQTTNHSKIEILVADFEFDLLDYAILRLLDIPAHRSHSDVLSLVRANDFVFCPYVGCEYKVFSNTPRKQPVLYIGLFPTHVKGFTDRETQCEMRVGPPDQDGKTFVCLEQRSPSENWHACYVAFSMMDGISCLGCDVPPLKHHIWMYWQEHISEGRPNELLQWHMASQSRELAPGLFRPPRTRRSRTNTFFAIHYEEGSQDGAGGEPVITPASWRGSGEEFARGGLEDGQDLSEERSAIDVARFILRRSGAILMAAVLRPFKARR